MNSHSAKGLQLSTPTDTTIVLTRAFQAPRKLVWEAFTHPPKMRRWMLAPPGCTLARCECDARVGGVLSLAWKADDGAGTAGAAGTAHDAVMTLQGVFTEVVAHERMVHTETMALGTGETIGTMLETHEFTETGGVTTMRITQAFDSKVARDGALDSGMDQCMEAGFLQLDAMLVQPA